MALFLVFSHLACIAGGWLLNKKYGEKAEAIKTVVESPPKP